MMLQEFVPNRKKLSVCTGLTDEYVVLKKNSRSTNRFNQNNIFDAILQSDTQYINGSMLTIEEQKYFVVSRRNSVLSNTAQLYKVNSNVSIVSLAKHYTSGNFDYYTSTVISSSTPAMYKDITAKMQQFDLGLRSDTVKKFILPIASINLLNRINFEGKHYQINSIDITEYEGLLSVQCSEDTRVVKTV